MKKSFVVLCLFLTVQTFAQSPLISITLESGSTINSDYLELKNMPFMADPYIIISNSEKISLKKVSLYEGYDQNGDYRSFQKINLSSNGRFTFSERILTLEEFDRIKIYNESITSGNQFISDTYNSTFYRKDNSEFKSITFKNLVTDLSDCPSSKKYLKKAGFYRIMQWVSAGAGAIIATKVIYDYSTAGDFNLETSDTDKIMFGSAGVLLTIPLVLNNGKEKNYKKALMNY